jgi:hypothetical protein
VNIVITAQEILVDDQIQDRNGPVVTKVTVRKNGRIQFVVDNAAKYTLDPDGIMEVWRNPRYAENIDVNEMNLIDDAIIHATITGSVGGNMSVQEVDGRVRFVKMERVAVGHAAGWRVGDHHNPELIGKVVVSTGLPGRYATHAAS